MPLILSNIEYLALYGSRVNDNHTKSLKPKIFLYLNNKWEYNRATSNGKEKIVL